LRSALPFTPSLSSLGHGGSVRFTNFALPPLAHGFMPPSFAISVFRSCSLGVVPVTIHASPACGAFRRVREWLSARPERLTGMVNASCTAYRSWIRR
ncbi:uncharacterized protein SCHCODRAFT_02496335, partial [Schizophyllum commune H4-8]|uniref:uncharacterized protein n=1 Tax=Schizophyllum commune (strain H4-8 / FGSC 9210) TaxID=578458 RepID=UPI00215F993D